jgi:hypothetical protein
MSQRFIVVMLKRHIEPNKGRLARVEKLKLLVNSYIKI